MIRITTFGFQELWSPNFQTEQRKKSSRPIWILKQIQGMTPFLQFTHVLTSFEFLTFSAWKWSINAKHNWYFACYWSFMALVLSWLSWSNLLKQKDWKTPVHHTGLSKSPSDWWGSQIKAKPAICGEKASIAANQTEKNWICSQGICSFPGGYLCHLSASWDVFPLTFRSFEWYDNSDCLLMRGASPRFVQDKRWFSFLNIHGTWIPKWNLSKRKRHKQALKASRICRNLSWTIVNSKPILICKLTSFFKLWWRSDHKWWMVVNLFTCRNKTWKPPTKSPSFFLLLTTRQLTTNPGMQPGIHFSGPSMKAFSWDFRKTGFAHAPGGQEPLKVARSPVVS